MNGQRIIDFMKKYEILYAVIVDIDSYTLASFGWSYKLPYDGLLDVFRDEKSVRALNESLEGQIMPQSMGQSEVRCLLCKPQSNIVVGLFYTETREILESFKFGKQLNEELGALYKLQQNI